MKRDGLLIEPRSVFYCEGHNLNVSLGNNGSIQFTWRGYHGIAAFNPEDKFDAFIGLSLALRRLSNTLWDLDQTRGILQHYHPWWFFTKREAYRSWANAISFEEIARNFNSAFEKTQESEPKKILGIVEWLDEINKDPYSAARSQTLWLLLRDYNNYLRDNGVAVS